MCILSLHGDITAWCANLESDTNHQKFPSTNNKRTDINRTSTNSARDFQYSYCPLVHRKIVVFILLLMSFLVLPTQVNSAVLNSRKSSPIPEQFLFMPLSPTSTKPFSRKRLKRTSVGRPERHPWSPDLVTFVCDQLPDPCKRAAFLRLHTYHDLCSDLPPLYLLPHIDIGRSLNNQSSVQLCSTSEKGSRSTDGLYRSYLDTPERCRQSMDLLITLIRSSLKEDGDVFVDILEHTFGSMPANNSLLEEYSQCQNAYWAWMCTVTFPIYYPFANLPPFHPIESTIPPVNADEITIMKNGSISRKPNPTDTVTARASEVDAATADLKRLSRSPRLKRTTATTRQSLFVDPSLYRLGRVQPCITWCTQVETVCPYYNPGDYTGNGGEPTFLCDESHYQYTSHKTPHTIDKYTGCEHDCCFTKEDLLLDWSVGESTPSTFFPSTTNSALANKGLDAPPAQNLPKEEEYFSLTARCLQQELSDRLAMPDGAELTLLANYTQFFPTGEPHPGRTASASRGVNAYLLLLTYSTLVAILN